MNIGWINLIANGMFEPKDMYRRTPWNGVQEIINTITTIVHIRATLRDVACSADFVPGAVVIC